MRQPEGVLVNDVHSQLNPTLVNRILSVDSLAALQMAIITASQEGKAVCVAGGRHAMGAQQFGTGAVLVDMSKLNRVLNFDTAAGSIEVEAGIQWPELIAYLIGAQEGCSQAWGIAQKQTGADRLSIGGAIAANVHGRGLRMKPIIDDVESLVLVDAGGKLQRCDRQQQPELFRLVVGGYGLFGIVYSVTLRLVPRQKVQRIVETLTVDDLMPAFEQRIADGFLYGDFQFAVDERSDTFLHKGIFSCYRPVDATTPIPTEQMLLSDMDWMHLIYLAHSDKEQAYQRYAAHYLASSGQIYWSDTHQLGVYIDGYHHRLDHTAGAPLRATEMITEVYVPRPALASFMREAAGEFRRLDVNVVYGTIRLIERDEESYLAWAKEPYACIVFNLHIVHSPEGLEHVILAFRRLIDLAIHHGGSYYLTYHRYASRTQVEACYPQFAQFLRLKKQLDPEERFQSDWYRHYSHLFAER